MFAECPRKAGSESPLPQSELARSLSWLRSGKAWVALPCWLVEWGSSVVGETRRTTRRKCDVRCAFHERFTMLGDFRELRFATTARWARAVCQLLVRCWSAFGIRRRGLYNKCCQSRFNSFFLPQFHSARSVCYTGKPLDVLPVKFSCDFSTHKNIYSNKKKKPEHIRFCPQFVHGIWKTHI